MLTLKQETLTTARPGPSGAFEMLLLLLHDSGPSLNTAQEGMHSRQNEQLDQVGSTGNKATYFTEVEAQLAPFLLRVITTVVLRCNLPKWHGVWTPRRALP